MPYVTIIFDPQKVSQHLVDTLKPLLQYAVARVLNSDAVRLDPYSTIIDINTKPAEIMVIQHATHLTDVNVPPLEIYIEAGRPKGRSGDKIVELLGQAIAELGLIPHEYLGDGQAGIFVNFHENNGFGFIPKQIGRAHV